MTNTFTFTYLLNRNRLTDIEYRLVVASEERRWGMAWDLGLADTSRYIQDG